MRDLITTYFTLLIDSLTFCYNIKFAFISAIYVTVSFAGIIIDYVADGCDASDMFLYTFSSTYLILSFISVTTR